MSTTAKAAPEATSQTCQASLEKLYSDILALISSSEKGTGADLAARLRSVEQDLTHFKDQIRSIPNISVSEEKEREQIASLYRQIRLKDELIHSLAGCNITNGLLRKLIILERKKSIEKLQQAQPEQAASETSLQEKQEKRAQKNEKKIVCKYCKSVVLLKNSSDTWIDDEKLLPLARQQKGAPNTEQEPVTGFYGIINMMTFENVGFTHAVNNVKYLTCADCEYGPIGYVDQQTGMHYISPSRLEEQDE